MSERRRRKEVLTPPPPPHPPVSPPASPKVFLLTDSACCHLDGVLCYWMLVLCKKHGMVLHARYFPAEQDGKGGIDAVFGTLERFPYALQNKGIDTATPRQLFENLSPQHINLYA